MYQLYFYPGNANLAPHMVLEEIGAPYELILVDRNKHAHKSAEYLTLNPTGRIPVLVDGDRFLFEAAAICLHLADRHPEVRLAPPLGSAERGECYKWLMYEHTASGTDHLLLSGALERRRRCGGAGQGVCGKPHGRNARYRRSRPCCAWWSLPAGRALQHRGSLPAHAFALDPVLGAPGTLPAASRLLSAAHRDSPGGATRVCR